MSLDFLTDDELWCDVSVTTDGRILNNDGEEVTLAEIEESLANVAERIAKLKRMLKAAE